MALSRPPKKRHSKGIPEYEYVHYPGHKTSFNRPYVVRYSATGTPQRWWSEDAVPRHKDKPGYLRYKLQEDAQGHTNKLKFPLGETPLAPLLDRPPASIVLGQQDVVADDDRGTRSQAVKKVVWISADRIALGKAGTRGRVVRVERTRKSPPPPRLRAVKDNVLVAVPSGADANIQRLLAHGENEHVQVDRVGDCTIDGVHHVVVRLPSSIRKWALTGHWRRRKPSETRIDGAAAPQRTVLAGGDVVLDIIASLEV